MEEELKAKEKEKHEEMNKELEDGKTEGGARLAVARQKLTKLKYKLNIGNRHATKETPIEEEEEEEDYAVGPIRFHEEEKNIAIAQLAVEQAKIGTLKWARAKNRLKELKLDTLTEQQKAEWKDAADKER